MDHLKILKRALHITCKYRALWLIGLLLVLAGGGVGSGFSGGSSGGAPGSGGGEGGRWERDWGDLPRNLDPSDVWEKIAPIAIVIAIVVAVVFILAILFGVIRVILRYVTRTSLIQMVHSYEETGKEIGFWSGLRLGWSRSAFRLFLVDLILKLPLVLLMILLVVPLVGLAVPSFITGRGPMIALGVLLILLIIPVILLGVVIGVVLGLILEVAYRACAIEGLAERPPSGDDLRRTGGAWEAIKSAFGLIRRNLGATVLQWLLLVGLGIAWRIALIPVNILLVFLALLISGIPGLLVGGGAALLLGWPWGLGLGLLILIPIFIVIVSLPNLALTTFATIFYSTTWTLAYRELRAIDTGAPAERPRSVPQDAGDWRATQAFGEHLRPPL